MTSLVSFVVVVMATAENTDADGEVEEKPEEREEWNEKNEGLRHVCPGNPKEASNEADLIVEGPTVVKP
jgi:hypothetical protein